jgi:hypothetical protein
MAKTRMEYEADNSRQTKAGQKADDIVERLELAVPIDPFLVIKSERQLRAAGSNLGARYDGKLEFFPPRQLFLLYFNTKYDEGLIAGQHHPRTRFSICHELGHFFLDEHNHALQNGKAAHVSLSEFRTYDSIEREADAFASSLLMPTKQVKPLVNVAELSVARLIEISVKFNTSLVSTAFRAVRLSHFPCAIAGIKDNEVAWIFASDSTVNSGLYPRRGHLPASAATPWATCQSGTGATITSEGRASDWFTIYDNERLEDIYVTEEYVPVPVMNMMIVLLTMDEQDIYSDEDEEDEE